MAAVELGGRQQIKGGGEEANPSGAADGMDQESAGGDAGMKGGGEKTEQKRHAEHDINVACICEAGNDPCVENAVGERGNGENETGEGARSADIEERAGGSNRGTNENEGAEGADKRGERNEKRIGGPNVMVAASEKMAEFVGEKNGEQGEGEGQASSESGGMLVEKLEGANIFIERRSLIVSVGDGKLRAGGEASAESKEEQNACDDEHLARRAGDGGVVEIGGGSGAPIDVDGNGAARVFWGRWVHELLEEWRSTISVPKLFRLLGTAFDAL